MKNLTFFSSLLIILFLASCGEKDNSPEPGNEQRAFDVVFNGINISANYSVTTPIQTILLENAMSSTNKDKVAYVKSAEVLNDQSSISIQGLQTGASLNTVTVNIMDGTGPQAKIVYTYNVNLNASDSNGIKDSTNPCTAFLSNSANYLATKKSLNFQIILNAGAQDLSNITVTVHTTAIFNW